MFNGKKIAEIQDNTLEIRTNVRELNRAFAFEKTAELGRYMDLDKRFDSLSGQLDQARLEIQMLKDGISALLDGQTQILQNHKQFMQRPKRARRKSLRNTKGYTKISDEEKAQFMEMYNRGCSFLEISVATNRSSSAIGNYVRSQVEGVNND